MPESPARSSLNVTLGRWLCAYYDRCARLSSLFDAGDIIIAMMNPASLLLRQYE